MNYFRQMKELSKGNSLMEDIAYSKDEIIDIILKIVYPDKNERKTVDKAKVREYYRLFGDCIEYCEKGEDFINCMKEFQMELIDLVNDIIQADPY